MKENEENRRSISTHKIELRETQEDALHNAHACTIERKFSNGSTTDEISINSKIRV